MKMRVVKPAFFNGAMVQPGDTVEVKDNFKASWAVALDTPVSAAKEKAKPEPKALSELGGTKAKSFVEVHSKTDLA